MVKKAAQVKDIINSFALSLKNRGIKVNRLILYGSYAQGTPKPYSDIDIAVISSTFNNKNLLERQEILGEVIFSLQEPIEALGYSYREFAQPPRLSFLSEIIATGKVLYKES
jgi:predicted nucleotidyltransferase